MKKKIIAGVVAVGFIAVAAGGFFLWQYFSWQPPLPLTSAGFLHEEFIPSAPAIVFSFNPTDEAERKRFEMLWNIVLQDKKDALPLFLAELFSRDYLNASLEDIVALKKDPVRFTVAALRSGEDNKSPLEFSYFISGVNPEAAQKLIARFAESKKNIRGNLLGDTLLLQESDMAASAEIKNYGFSSFAKSSAFRNMFRGEKEPVSGYFFVDGGSFTASPDFSRKVFVSFHAQEDGLKFKTKAFGGEKTSLFESLGKPYAATLYQKFSAENLMVFAETHGIGDLFTDLEFVGKEFGEVLNFGSVFAVYDDGKLLPGMTLYFDGAALPEKTKELFKKMDEKFVRFIETVNLALRGGESEGSVIEGQLIAGMQHGRSVKLYPNRISQAAANIPLFQLFDEPVELSYGLTAENAFFISTMSSDASLFQGTGVDISTHAFFKDVLNLDDSPGDFVLIDSSTLGNFASRFVKILEEKEKLDDTDRATIGILSKYLAPLRGFVQVSKPDGDGLESQAFLRIAP